MRAHVYLRGDCSMQVIDSRVVAGVVAATMWSSSTELWWCGGSLLYLSRLRRGAASARPRGRVDKWSDCRCVDVARLRGSSLEAARRCYFLRATFCDAAALLFDVCSVSFSLVSRRSPCHGLLPPPQHAASSSPHHPARSYRFRCSPFYSTPSPALLAFALAAAASPPRRRHRRLRPLPLSRESSA